MRGVEQIPWLYDAVCAFAEWRGLGRWRQWVAGGARGRTLDLGCGTGRNLPLFTGASAVGLDPSFESLRRARRRAAGHAARAGERRGAAVPRRNVRHGRERTRAVQCAGPGARAGRGTARAQVRRRRSAPSSTCAPPCRGGRACRTRSSPRGRGSRAAAIPTATPSDRSRPPASRSTPRAAARR